MKIYNFTLNEEQIKQTENYLGMTIEQLVSDIIHNKHKGCNDYVLYDDYAEIIICNQRKAIKKRALISLDMVEKTSQYRWYEDGNNYVMSHINDIQASLHRFVLNAQPNQLVDHINGNKLDCRNENLRFCTQSQNAMNSITPNNNTSGYKGVSWQPTRKQWRAYITIHRKQIHLGTYDNIDDAIKARQIGDIKYHDVFAYGHGKKKEVT